MSILKTKIEQIETKTLRKIILVLTFYLVWSLLRERTYFISVENAITMTNQNLGGLSKIEHGLSGFNPFPLTPIGAYLKHYTSIQMIQISRNTITQELSTLI